MKKVLYPASFDPITYGHMDIVEQALKIFNKVVIAVLVNGQKKSGLFTIDERKALIEKIYGDNPRVEIIATDENISAVKIAIENGCATIARGLRNVTDFAEEIDLSALNLHISEGKINTVAFFANPGKTTISSSRVKELFRVNEKLDAFVHPIVEEAMKEKESKKHD